MTRSTIIESEDTPDPNIEGGLPNNNPDDPEGGPEQASQAEEGQRRGSPPVA